MQFSTIKTTIDWKIILLVVNNTLRMDELCYSFIHIFTFLVVATLVISSTTEARSAGYQIMPTTVMEEE